MKKEEFDELQKDSEAVFEDLIKNDIQPALINGLVFLKSFAKYYEKGLRVLIATSKEFENEKTDS